MPIYPYQPYYNLSPMQQLQNAQQQQMQMQNQQQPQQQIQNGGFISVRSQKEAWDYPIAPGNSVTFIDENAMRCYIKTKGFSPFEQPRFDTYRLVKEEPPKQEDFQAKSDEEEKESNSIEYAQKDEIEAISARINRLKNKVDDTIDRVNNLYARIEAMSIKKQSQKPQKEDDTE